MPIKLLVTHTGDDAATEEHVFHQETVMIGRDAANVLTLPDPSRIVSKHHAEIRPADDGGYELVDLGSKNFTYYNGKRLTSGQPVRLSPGDQFKIGEFEVVFDLEAPRMADEAPTVFAAAFVNPFEESAEKLAEVLGSLRRAYATASGPRRADALRDALNAAMIGGGDEPGAVVAQVLGGAESGDGGAPSPVAPPAAPPAQPRPSASPPSPPLAPSSEEGPPPGKGPKDPFAQTSAQPFAPLGAPPSLGSPPETPAPSASPPSPPPAPPARPPAQAPGRAAPMGAGSERVLDVLLEAVQKLIAIPWRFRHEFIGQTIVQTEESAFLYEKSPDELKAYLADPRGQEERLEALADAADAVAVHQLAMLDGYKASVQLGAKRLLDAVDPKPIEDEVEASSPMYKVAQLRAKAVLDRVKEIHGELGGEDWSVAERRAFRPAFIKAYLARMTRRKG
jgi:predicted component of type VI protein secretion system